LPPTEFPDPREPAANVEVGSSIRLGREGSMFGRGGVDACAEVEVEVEVEVACLLRVEVVFVEVDSAVASPAVDVF
jgi:hypothetical protein